MSPPWPLQQLHRRGSQNAHLLLLWHLHGSCIPPWPLWASVGRKTGRKGGGEHYQKKITRNHPVCTRKACPTLGTEHTCLPHCVQPPALCQGNSWQGELTSHSPLLYHNQRHQMWVHSLWPYTIKMKYIWCLIYFCTVSYAEIQLRVQKDTQFMLVGIQHSPASCHLPQVSPLHPWGRARGGACDPFSVPQQFDVSSSFPTLSATQHWGLIQRKQKLSVISAGQIDGRFTLVVTTELDAYVHCYSLLLCLGL